MTGDGYAHRLLDVYCVDVHVVWKRKAWKRLRKRLPWIGTCDSAGLSAFSVWCPKKGARGLPRGHLVLWIDVDHHENLPQLVDSMAHEAAHGALRVLEWVGVPVAGDSSEAYAYLVGWLTRHLLETVDTTGV